MNVILFRSRVELSPNNAFESPVGRSNKFYERGLTKRHCVAIRLEESLAREQALLRQKNDMIQRQEIVNREADHRVLNGCK
jgi:hypothetical protein